MFARALIVLLVVLNLGVASWWLARPSADAEPRAAPRAEGPQLFLLEEVPVQQRSMAPSPSVAADGAPVAASVDEVDAVAPAEARCFSLGPFSDATAAATARRALAGSGLRDIRVREQAIAARGWSVAMPPLADRAAANAMATRLREAGFEDLFVLSSGTSANGIALGRYGNETSARQRVEALREAGFEAVASPVGEGGSRVWLDVAADSEAAASAARRTSGADVLEPRDCAAR